MKRLLSIIVVLIMLTLVMAGCGGNTSKLQNGDEGTKQVETKASSSEAGKAVDEKDLPVLRVAIMPYTTSLSVKYAIDNGLDIKNGFKIETTLFNSGAPMNEALGANLWDAGTIGPAVVFTVAQYDAKIIANLRNASTGNELFARADSEAAKVKGFNPTFPELRGDPDSLRGKKVLLPIGTVAQVLTLKWAEKIGIKDTELDLVHMDFAQAYQAFSAGQGDFVTLTAPVSQQAYKNGWVKVGSLDDLNVPLHEALVVNKLSYESKKDLLVKLVKVIFEANAELEKDLEFKTKYLQKWYKENGQDIPYEQVKFDATTGTCLTSEDQFTGEIGDTVKMMAEFMVSIGQLEADKLPMYEKNCTDEIVKLAFKK